MQITNGKHKKSRIRQFIAKPKGNTTFNSLLKSPKDSQFYGKPPLPANDMDQNDTRMFLGIAIGYGVKCVMKNHFFKIGGRIFRQRDGGAIGLDLTVEIASLYMSMWEYEYLEKCRSLGIHLDIYGRYVDDIFIVCDAINPGWS